MSDDYDMQEIGAKVRESLPEGYGFFVMAFPFGDADGRRASYVSNGRREDVLKTMRELIALHSPGNAE